MKFKRNHSKAQAAKTKFRRSSKWMKFRKYMKEKQKFCAVTGSKLGPTANLHHINLDETQYENIECEKNFIFLSKTAHEVVHWLWGKGTNDWRGRLKALWRILYRMEQVNTRISYGSTKNTTVEEDTGEGLCRL